MRSSVTAIIFLSNTLFARSFDFVDQAGRNGLEFDHDHGGSGDKFYVETMGSGVCLLDYDNDNDSNNYNNPKNMIMIMIILNLIMRTGKQPYVWTFRRPMSRECPGPARGKTALGLDFGRTSSEEMT